MGDIEKFEAETLERVNQIGREEGLKKIAYDFQHETGRFGYLYNFRWLGLPIIQYPQDIVALQEIIFKVQPDLIIETGVARGGSVIFSASMLALLDLMSGSLKQPDAIQRKVVGIDIDIRVHNREAIESHPLASYVQLIQGSSVDADVVQQVHALAQGHQRVLVLLDSNHTHEHVLQELNAYAPLVSVGSYAVVYDTVIELSPKGYYTDRPWDVGNSPLSAVKQYLGGNDDFVIDADIPDKLLITVAPDGFLKRVK
jgi:cephalosporin hydroxylase